MKIKFSIGPNDPTVTLEGELDEHTSEYVRLTLDTLLGEFFDKKITRVVLDLSKLSFMDSTGVGVLLGRYKKWGGRNMLICIKRPSPHVDRVLKLSGIYQIMPNVS